MRKLVVERAGCKKVFAGFLLLVIVSGVFAAWASPRQTKHIETVVFTLCEQGCGACKNETTAVRLIHMERAHQFAHVEFEFENPTEGSGMKETQVDMVVSLWGINFGNDGTETSRDPIVLQTNHSRTVRCFEHVGLCDPISVVKLPLVTYNEYLVEVTFFGKQTTNLCDAKKGTTKGSMTLDIMYTGFSQFEVITKYVLIGLTVIVATWAWRQREPAATRSYEQAWSLGLLPGLVLVDDPFAAASIYAPNLPLLLLSCLLTVTFCALVSLFWLLSPAIIRNNAARIIEAKGKVVDQSTSSQLEFRKDLGGAAKSSVRIVKSVQHVVKQHWGKTMYVFILWVAGLAWQFDSTVERYSDPSIDASADLEYGFLFYVALIGGIAFALAVGLSVGSNATLFNYLQPGDNLLLALNMATLTLLILAQLSRSLTFLLCLLHAYVFTLAVAFTPMQEEPNEGQGITSIELQDDAMYRVDFSGGRDTNDDHYEENNVSLQGSRFRSFEDSDSESGAEGARGYLASRNMANV